MDEFLFDDRFLSGTDITTLDFAKTMIDEGVHSITMNFPLVVLGELLIQPTETKTWPPSPGAPRPAKGKPSRHRRAGVWTRPGRPAIHCYFGGPTIRRRRSKSF